VIEVGPRMADVEVVLDQLVREFESGANPAIESYLNKYPEHRDELLDFWMVLASSGVMDEGALDHPDRDRLSEIERDSIRDLLLASSLGPEMLERAGGDGGDTGAELGAELERIRAVPYSFGGKAPATFRRIAVYAWIAGVLSEETRSGVSRLRVQKVAYLLEHGLSLGVFQKHAKYRYGPYDPSLTYRDAEPGCLKAKYLEKSSGELLVPGPKLAKAVEYARRYLREESVARAFAVHLSRLDERALETLTTVHSVAVELGPQVDARGVAKALAADAKWESKLRRGNFSEERIEEALRTLRRLRLTSET